jgi:hypothetical protein
MSRIHPECPNSGLSDRSVAADVLLRQEPDEVRWQSGVPMCGERGVVVRVVTSTKPAPNTSHEIEHAGFHNPHDRAGEYMAKANDKSI